MLQKLKTARIEAMKSKDDVAKSVLSCLQSDANGLAKKSMRETLDKDVIDAADSLITKLKDGIKLAGEKATEDQKREVVILGEYARTILSESETTDLVNSIFKDLSSEEKVKKNQGKIMTQLKTHETLSVKIDMKIASQLVSKLLV